jgi:hypothetical protein
MLSASASFAPDTQAVWEGYATVTASTIQCQGHGGTGVSDTHVTIYRPKILTTDTATYIDFVFLRTAVTFENSNETTVHQMRGAGNYSATQIDSRALPFIYIGTYSFTFTPNVPITTTTNPIKMTGTIDGFDNAPGCNVTFEAVFVKRID